MRKYIAFVLEVAVFLHVASILSNASTRTCNALVGKNFERKSNVMAADVSVHLFNIKTYKEKVLPAYRRFLRQNEPGPLIMLLTQCAEKLEANPQLAEKLLWDKESVEEDIGILTGTVYYSPDDGNSSNQGGSQAANRVKRKYAREILSPKILQVLCVPYDKTVNPAHDMTNAPLASFLIGRSEWIKDLLTFIRTVQGGRLELAIGESSELFTKEDVQEFNVELKKVTPPESVELRKEYDNLRALLNLALEDPNLTLVLTVG